MRTPEQCLLYGILDTGYCAPERLGAMLEQMIAGGVEMVQLRAKGMAGDRVAELARDLHPLSRAAAVPLILNDHPELVGETGVEGARVGVEDMTVGEAGRLAGRGCWSGKSSHSVAQAIEGWGQGADYLGFGPLFATLTKPDYVPIGTAAIHQVHAEVGLPIFCIGGIKLENLGAVRAAGARRVVIVRGILQAGDVAGYVRQCAEGLRGAVI